MTSKGKATHLLNLIEKEKLDQILKAFTDATGVASIITEIDGSPISSPYNFTKLCEHYCRSTDEGRRRCYASDMYGGQQAALLKKCVTYRCLNAGLIDAAAPVIVDNQHIANILFGQVVEFPIEREVAIDRAHAVGIRDIDGYLLELEKVPLMSLDQFSAVGNLMEVVTQTISELAYQKYQLIKHSKRNLSKLVNSVSDCIISMDQNGNIIMANEASKTIFGTKQRPLTGRCLIDLLADDESIRSCRDGLSAGPTTRTRINVNALDADENILPMQMSLSSFVISDKGHNGYVAVLRDISEEMKLEQMRKDLAGMLSHDLGNPVLSIQKAMRLLADGTLGPMNADQREIAGLALETSRQLYGMVTDFLDIYRYENHRLVLRRSKFNMHQLLNECVSQIQLFASDKNISIHIESPAQTGVIRADRNRLMRVCTNILENALQFTPENRNIWIRLNRVQGGEILNHIPDLFRQEATAQSLLESYLMVSFSDEGLGIPRRDQKFIFDKFFSSKTRGTGESGRKSLGLGLAFCKLAVESHNGFIWLKSPLFTDKVYKRRGCRFTFALPAPSTQARNDMTTTDNKEMPHAQP